MKVWGKELVRREFERGLEKYWTRKEEVGSLIEGERENSGKIW
jgi:hypothetical protein